MSEFPIPPTEYGNINRQIKTLMEQYLDGDTEAMDKIMRLARRREELLRPRKYDKGS